VPPKGTDRGDDEPDNADGLGLAKMSFLQRNPIKKGDNKPTAISSMKKGRLQSNESRA